MSGSGLRMIAATAAAGLLLAPEAALAYGGPGSVVSGVGALLAVLAAIAAAFVGFLWFPVKRLMQRLRGPAEEQQDEATRVP